MEERGFDMDFREKLFLHGDGGFGRTGDEQDFLVFRKRAEQAGEPDVGGAAVERADKGAAGVREIR